MNETRILREITDFILSRKTKNLLPLLRRGLGGGL